MTGAEKNSDWSRCAVYTNWENKEKSSNVYYVIVCQNLIGLKYRSNEFL